MLTSSPYRHKNIYKQGRTIEPISFIEQWSLCHHLASTVKYIARAGHSHDLLNDLKKAEWYLTREMSRYKKGFNQCHLALVDLERFTLQDVLDDWALSRNLEETLINVMIARDQDMPAQALKEALMSLQKEILHYGG